MSVRIYIADIINARYNWDNTDIADTIETKKNEFFILLIPISKTYDQY